VIKDQFYQERLYTEHEILGLLRQNNFWKCTVFQDDVGIDKEMSKRNQDLGMMENRMIIIGKKSDGDVDEFIREEEIEDLEHTSLAK
jgi:hypothetical protein